MMKLAMENNLSETAFIVKETEGYHLRWFTPGTEVELCGHATLASAFVILNFYEPDSRIVQFNTLSGVLTVKRTENLYEMDFPTYELREIPVTDAMERAFGVRPVRAVLGLDLVVSLESFGNADHAGFIEIIGTGVPFVDQQHAAVREMIPDQSALMQIEGRIQNATARGNTVDCISRSFCPKLSIAEDPVCGSAHVQIADYWMWELGKDAIDAYQASRRGGYLHCERREDGRMSVSGEAVLVAISELAVSL